MVPRVLLTVAVAALLATAGCLSEYAVEAGPTTTGAPETTTDRRPGETPSATPPTDTPGTPASPTVSTTPSPETTTPPPETTTPPPETTTPPPENDPSGTDVSALTRDHLDALRTAGSFTAVWRYERTAGSNDSNGWTVFRADFAADRFLSNGSATDSPAVARYTDGGTTYERRIHEDGTVRYSRATDPVDVTAATGESLLTAMRGIGLEPNGTETLDGESMRVYDVSTDDPPASLKPAGFETLTGAFVRLLVDDDGVVRSLVVNLVGSNAAGESAYVSYTLRVTRVGTTEVRPPDWLDEAKSAEGDG